MEDQPADSGDLTSDAAAPVPQGKDARKRRATEDSETPAEDAVAATPSASARRRRWTWRPRKAVADPETPSESTESDVDVEPADATEAKDATEPEPEPILVPHRTAPKALKIVAVIASVLVVAAAAFAGSVLQPYLADRAVVQTKQEVAQRAADAIRVLWTYTPEDIDQLGDRTAKYLGGDLAKQYREFIDAIAEANKQAQVTNSTEVVGAAVESLTPTEASAIVYTNTVSTSPVTKGIPSLRYISYRLTLERRDRQWLITKMNDITSLDLTPRL